jgi:transposase
MTRSATTQAAELFVGVDVAATTFTVHWEGETTSAPPTALTLAQTALGFETLQRRLRATGLAPAQTRVVLEATSTYWIALAVTLHEAGYHVSIVNPAHIHHYAKSL